MRANLPFVRNRFVEIYFLSYFWPSVSKSCPHCAATMRRGLCHYRWQVNTHILRYRAVPLTSWMVHTLNVNVNIDLCFMLSCELVERLPNLKRCKLSTASLQERVKQESMFTFTFTLYTIYEVNGTARYLKMWVLTCHR